MNNNNQYTPGPTRGPCSVRWNLCEFLENLVECLRRAAEVGGVAVLSFDVGAQLFVQCRRVREVPLHGAHHRTDRLVAGQILQVVRLIPVLRIDKNLIIYTNSQ